MLFTLSSNCKLVLNSKAKDEQLTNFAKWEPWHGKFGLYYPWGKYLQLGDHLRELAFSIISLTSCLQYSKQEKYFDGLETGDLSLFLIVEILVNPEFAVYKVYNQIIEIIDSSSLEVLFLSTRLFKSKVLSTSWGTHGAKSFNQT
ncbi:hypothetical protein G4B88_001348 [Cannabis sativa]|uniref:Uncharacterized protein n=1 Tax=Cannabis sativa TaxID=3483 RepID=A0A7J6HZX0_CANSA|nr:hypothetical protein G4B88_001348 [Cannabis sativa]